MTFAYKRVSRRRATCSESIKQRTCTDSCDYFLIQLACPTAYVFSHFGVTKISKLLATTKISSCSGHHSTHFRSFAAACTNACKPDCRTHVYQLMAPTTGTFFPGLDGTGFYFPGDSEHLLFTEMLLYEDVESVLVAIGGSLGKLTSLYQNAGRPKG